GSTETQPAEAVTSYRIVGARRTCCRLGSSKDSRPVTVPWRLNVGYIRFVSGRMCSFQLAMNCASLICSRYRSSVSTMGCVSMIYGRASSDEVDGFPDLVRSDERRVGKECRARWWSYH